MRTYRIELVKMVAAVKEGCAPLLDMVTKSQKVNQERDTQNRIVKH